MYTNAEYQKIRETEGLETITDWMGGISGFSKITRSKRRFVGRDDQNNVFVNFCIQKNLIPFNRVRITYLENCENAKIEFLKVWGDSQNLIEKYTKTVEPSEVKQYVYQVIYK